MLTIILLNGVVLCLSWYRAPPEQVRVASISGFSYTNRCTSLCLPGHLRNPNFPQSAILRSGLLHRSLEQLRPRRGASNLCHNSYSKQHKPAAQGRHDLAHIFASLQTLYPVQTSCHVAQSFPNPCPGFTKRREPRPLASGRDVHLRCYWHLPLCRH